VPGVLETLAGLKLTQGAITQDARRRARGQVGIAYQQLRRAVRESPAVYTDDTGWRVGGENAHLMAFDTDEVTVYQVWPRHRHQEVQRWCQ
jgi:transposase